MSGRGKMEINQGKVRERSGNVCRIDVTFGYLDVQWNPSCEAAPFAIEKWPLKRGGVSSGVEINTSMFRFTLPSGLSRGIGLSSGWPRKRGSPIPSYMKNITRIIT